jgi:hypothetical protein
MAIDPEVRRDGLINLVVAEIFRRSLTLMPRFAGRGGNLRNDRVNFYPIRWQRLAENKGDEDRVTGRAICMKLNGHGNEQSVSRSGS